MSTPIRPVAPWVRGQGFVLAATSDLPQITSALRGAGHTVADVAGATGMRAMQTRIAEALHLPATAGINLDALVDSLRDLDRWWPGTQVLVLAWHDADLLVEHDLPGWLELIEILRGAARLQFPGTPDGESLQFEALAGIRGHGVVPFAGSSDAPPAHGRPAIRQVGQDDRASESDRAGQEVRASESDQADQSDRAGGLQRDEGG